MKTIGRLALTGLVTVLPLALTLYVIWWLGSGAEDLLGGLLRRVLPEGLYVPGAGLVLGLVFLVGLGLVMRALVARKVAHLFDRLMERIPLVKSIYGSVADMLSLFTKKRVSHVEQVVLITLADPHVRILGLVTRPEVPEIDAGVEGDPVAVVYVPMSYGIGGYALLARRSSLTPVPMSVEQALRFAVTAGAPSKSQ
jgi:uncharacterized membrane protein